MGLRVVILAAGKGKRMLSKRPKVLEKVGGITLLDHVVQTATQLKPDEIIVVYGNGGSAVPDECQYSKSVRWVVQEEQLGTGHAVMQALPFCKDEDQILVLYGDVPLITPETLNHLLQKAPQHGLALIVAELDDPTGFGRIIRDKQKHIVAIIEHKDATPEQLHIQEINTGILTAPANYLKAWLPRVRNQNKQNEYYLTDVISLAVNDKQNVIGVLAESPKELQGINDQWQLTLVERYYQYNQAKKLALSGVTIKDPARLDIRGNVSVGTETVLDVNVILEGNVKIGNNCIIGPNVYIKNSVIGDFVEIYANCVIDGAEIKLQATVGPFARVRPETIIEEQAKVGNFVEIKKTILGKNSKAPHLTYLGDAIIGKYVNIGAGTITCNYDGVKKSQTKIDDYVFIGSNSSLVAPLTIGAHATIGAGSTITKNVSPDNLTLSRAPQETIKNWQSPQKKQDTQKIPQ